MNYHAYTSADRSNRPIRGLEAVEEIVGDLSSALSILSEDSESPSSNKKPNLEALRRALAEYYVPQRALDDTERETILRRGQIGWSHTSLATHQRRAASNFLSCNIGRIWPTHQSIRLVDLGSGDGRMCEAVISGLAGVGVQVLQAHLIDQNRLALSLAKSRLDSSVPVPYLEVSFSDFRSAPIAGGFAGEILVLASAALHELNDEDRLALLRRIAADAQGLAIVELAQDNNTEKSLTSPLISQVVTFYNLLMSDAYASLEPCDHWPVIGVFLLGEMLQILTSSYRERGNYHLSAEGWDRTLVEAGFEVAARDETVCAGLKTVYRLARPLAFGK